MLGSVTRAFAQILMPRGVVRGKIRSRGSNVVSSPWKRLVVIATLVCLSAAAALSVLAFASSGHHRISRPPIAKADTTAIAREVKLTLSIWADACPRSAFCHGTDVLMYPTCLSTVDRRYASVIISPMIHGQSGGQPVELFVRAVRRGYRVVGMMIDNTFGSDPRDVPMTVWRELVHRPACQPGAALSKKLPRVW